MGWKDWVYGDLVSAADFQSLVQDQTVQRYADSAARTSALGSAVAEGMVSYLDSTNALEVYDGSSWGAVSSSGSGNAIINGAFDIWQRGSSFGSGILTYTADRWLTEQTANATVSRQTFTPGSAPVAGYEGQYYLRYVADVAGAVHGITQRIEDVRTFAGQTVTLSFWAKANAATTMLININQYFGTGGSADVYVEATQALTTTWTRYTKTLSIASIAGKTIGANNHLQVRMLNTLGATFTMDIWGVQLEAGSSATPFKRNAPSIQGELAACQRYYYRTSTTAANPYAQFTQSYGANLGTQAYLPIRLPVTMRTAPSSIEYANLQLADGVNAGSTVTTAFLDINTSSENIQAVGFNVSSGLTQYRPYVARGNNSASAYIGLSAEL